MTKKSFSDNLNNKTCFILCYSNMEGAENAYEIIKNYYLHNPLSVRMIVKVGQSNTLVSYPNWVMILFEEHSWREVDDWLCGCHYLESEDNDFGHIALLSFENTVKNRKEFEFYKGKIDEYKKIEIN